MTMDATFSARLGDRSLFPDLGRQVYVNHGAISPPSLPVRRAVTEVLDDYARRGAAAFGRWAAQRSALEVLKLRLWAIAHDLWTTVKSRAGWTGLVICALPVGAGALTNLFSAMAVDYSASGSEVEMVNGLGGGVIGALGSLVGGVLADKMNRRVAYAISGGLTAFSGLAMMAAPMTPATYTWGVLAYSFANGIAFATLAAFILEMVGHSAAAATKYTLFIAIANVASNYVTALDGAASEFRKLGSRGALFADAVLTFAGIVVLMLMVRLNRSRDASSVPAAA